MYSGEKNSAWSKKGATLSDKSARKEFELSQEKKKLYIPEAYLAIVVSPEEPDGAALLLEPNANPIAKTYQEGVYKAGLPVIVFGVDDIYKEYERLKSPGVVFRKEPAKTEWGIETVFEDTCGNLIQLHQG